MNYTMSEHMYQYGTTIIYYNLVRSRRVKTCEIIIDNENTVVNRAPYSKPIAEIESLLKNKMNWISRKQIEYKDKEHSIEIIRPTYENNSTVPYLGGNLKLNIIQSYSTDKDTVESKSNQLFAFIKTDNKVSINDTMLKIRVKSLYEKWLAREAIDLFKRKVLEFSKMVKVHPNKIIIKNLRNRWGSVSKEGALNLNVNLLKAPNEVINYIIIHEMCHFIIKGHSHHFWELIRSYFPRYHDAIKWLDVNSNAIL
jgi:predicted metal-dependent hydrolase